MNKSWVVHDGSTRPRWAQDRLAELNLGAAQSADLPSDDLCRVISELFDPDDFERHNDKVTKQGDTNPDYLADVQLALASLSKLVQRHGLIALALHPNWTATSTQCSLWQSPKLRGSP